MKLVKTGTNTTELVFDGNMRILFSYDTPVAGRDSKGWFRTTERFSQTTTKHVNSYTKGLNVREVDQEYINSLVGEIA